MTLAEKHKIKAEEKKLEIAEARAAFRINRLAVSGVLRLYDFRFLHGFYHKVRVQAFPGYIFHGGVHVPLE